ncbi:MAG: insulinase family protein [Gemmatimonadetes bacterium]|nr:insulinase family protein [Gemmatimonadota bacterium]
MTLHVPWERHTLANGLRVVLSPDPSTAVVGVNLWYGVGSRNERAGRTGFAHLFEHMMFQGSAHVPKNRHFELVERAGGSLNATTWFDRTNYFETLPSHEMELALYLESDRMGWMLPALTQETFDNQREVVKNEKRQRYDNQPYGDWDERMQVMMYPSTHPYHHTVIGSMADLDASTLDDVVEFFRTYYVPNNAVLSIAGDLIPERALAAVERWFGEIPMGAPIPPLPGTSELPPRLDGTVRDRVRADVPLPRVIIGARVPTFLDPAFHAVEIAVALLGTGRSSRLYRRLVRERRIAKDVAAYAFPLVTGASMIVIWASGYPGTNPDHLEAALVEEIEGLAKVGEEEVARAVALTDTRFVRTLEEVAERADLLSMFTLLFDDPDRLNQEMERIRAVTAADVRAVAERWLGGDNRAVLTYEPAA